eukprot:TRINITY_DN12682_c0_g6_i2.p1 TRINITY_DN12682_c0_g6~~TRINITY_DN12682_c0_g6_i2.p1  ORF type:complete len:406 (+),score=57.90 TRINITY_DN12682_c0_g6_i2:102-1220(+)
MCIRDRSTWGLVINVMMPRVSEAPVSAENASPSQSLSSSPYATVRKSSIKDYQIDTIFFNRLLRLEEKLFRRTYTLETISDLVTLYSQAVEYYDAKKDPSKQYYLEKIQFTLTNEEIFRVLLSNIRKNSNSRNEIGSSPGNTNLSLPESEEDEMDSDKEEFKMRESPAMRRLSTKDVSSGAKSRLTTMRMSLILKLERSKSSEKNDMKNIVTDFEKNQKVNDDVVKVNLENQVDNFKARHAKKRKMNQAKKSHSRNASSTSNLFANIDRAALGLPTEDDWGGEKRKGANAILTPRVHSNSADFSPFDVPNKDFQGKTIIIDSFDGDENTPVSPIRKSTQLTENANDNRTFREHCCISLSQRAFQQLFILKIT